MKNPDRKIVIKLEELPNIGKSIARYLRLIGIDSPSMLIGGDPFKMYFELCQKAGKKIDPCVIDVFMSAVSFMGGNKPQPWWQFTKERRRSFQAE